MADFTPDNALGNKYSALDKEFTSFVVQPAFVETIVAEKKMVHSIEEAFRFIFRNNKEFGVFLWNGIPVRFCYIDDLPLMIKPLIGLLSTIHSEQQIVRFSTPNLSFEWSIIAAEGDQLTIRQNHRKISGGYEQVLNQLGTIMIQRNDFTNEWKLLLHQLVEAFDRSELELSDQNDQELLQQLRALNEHIKGPGSLYSYDRT